MAELFSVPRPRSSAVVRLFCLPHAGSGPRMFLPWADCLSEAIELWLITLPGHGQRMREPLLRRMGDVVAEVGGRFPVDGKPFALFGHSMGALIAFELTRFLEKEQGAAPVHLFVSACRAPHIAASKPPLHELPPVRLWEHLRVLGGTPPEVLASTKLRRLLAPVVRADLQVYENYTCVPSSVSPFPIGAFGGLEDRSVALADLGAWKLHTGHSFSLDLLPGDHFYLYRADTPLFRMLSDRLTRRSEQWAGLACPGSD